MNAQKAVCLLVTLLSSSVALGGDSGCPACDPIGWTLAGVDLSLSGEGLGNNVVSAVLVIEDGWASCELDLPLGVVAGHDPWQVELDYGSECGTDLGGSQILVDRGTGFVAEAVLAP